MKRSRSWTTELTGLQIDDGVSLWLTAALAMLCVAIAAGLGDRRRKRRADLDAVGWVDWPTVQIGALIAAAMLMTIALHGQNSLLVQPTAQHLSEAGRWHGTTRR